MSFTSDDRKLNRFPEEEEKLNTGVLNSQHPKWGILCESSALNLKQKFLWIKQVVWVFWSGLLQNCLTLLTATVKIMLSLANCVIPVALLLVCSTVEIPYSLTRSWYFYLDLNMPSGHKALKDFIVNEGWLFQDRKQNRKNCSCAQSLWQADKSKEIDKELQLCSTLLTVQKHGCMAGYTGKG